MSSAADGASKMRTGESTVAFRKVKVIALGKSNLEKNCASGVERVKVSLKRLKN